MLDRASTGPGRPMRLPNGLNVAALNDNDTLMVYRDIFDEDCYRRGGVTIRDGDCILDVGANTGMFILYLNTILSHAKVYAFEPLPSTFRVLRRNVEAHNHLDIDLFNVGLSKRAGRATFTHYPRMSNASTMYPDASPPTARRERGYVLDRFRKLPQPLAGLLALCPRVVRTILAERVRKHYLKAQPVSCELDTLSRFLARHQIARVDLLKVDTERSERPILAGLADSDWPRIRQMIVEVHEGEEATRSMVELLSRRGFRTAVEPNPSFPGLSLVYGVRPDS